MSERYIDIRHFSLHHALLFTESEWFVRKLHTGVNGSGRTRTSFDTTKTAFPHASDGYPSMQCGGRIHAHAHTASDTAQLSSCHCSIASSKRQSLRTVNE
eukprot:scpid17001/ scgid18563/ 